jgi:hypothetical protein
MLISLSFIDLRNRISVNAGMRTDFARRDLALLTCGTRDSVAAEREAALSRLWTAAPFFDGTGSGARPQV